VEALAGSERTLDMAEDDAKEVWWEDLPEDIANTVFRLEMTIPGKGSVAKDLRPDLKVMQDSIEDHLRMNAAARYFWSVLHADMRAHVGKLERLLKSRKGIARKKIAEELSQTEIKQTDKLLDALVDSDAEVLKIEDDIGDAWHKVNKLASLITSIDMRHESLRSLAGFKKGERNL
jgi:hypothetical protein